MTNDPAMEAFFAQLQDRMADLEDTLNTCGASAWEGAITVYHPEVPGAYIVVESRNADLGQVARVAGEAQANAAVRGEEPA